MKVKPLVKTEDILSVFFKINAQAVVHHRETHKFIFMRSLDRDMRRALGVAVFNGVADQVIENAFNIRRDRVDAVSFAEIIDDPCQWWYCSRMCE